MHKNSPDNQQWDQFVELCSNIKSPEKLKAFFDLFLTIEEKEVIGSRLVIVQALLEGKQTQREIANIYKVSISQITRGSNALKVADPQLINFLNSKKTWWR